MISDLSTQTWIMLGRTWTKFFERASLSLSPLSERSSSAVRFWKPSTLVMERTTVFEEERTRRRIF